MTRWHEAHGYNAKRKKTELEYEDDLRHIMYYGDYENVRDIKSIEDIDNIFKGMLGHDPRDRRKLRQSTFRDKMIQAWRRVVHEPRKETRGDAQIVKESSRVYVGKGAFRQAREQGEIIHFNNTLIYKSEFQYRGKEVIRYRDYRGRFVAYRS